MSVTHADFTIERHFGCTPRQTFSVFSDPELKRQWFANPGSWPDAKWKLQFRVGGGEVSRGGSPGGIHHAFKSRFHDIVENERIVFAYDLLLDHQLISVSLTTIQFASPTATVRGLCSPSRALLRRSRGPGRTRARDRQASRRARALPR